LDIPIKLAANFGELRTNHWHMGLDIRTEHRENLPVHAAADGYIAKIRIEPFGFGQAIFINHPNGLTTAYGHLNRFFPALESYIIEQQYKKESWQIELNLPPNLFSVKKGQLIAYSGNTGGSQGPHLHFEIRDTKTERCLNPLLFGFPVPDNVPPSLVRLAMYDRGFSVYDQTPQLFSLVKNGSGYSPAKSKLIKTASQRISFAIQANDKQSGSANPNGIYSAKLFFDEKPQVEFVLDSIDYIETRDVNAQIDYKYKSRGGPYLQHISQLPGNPSPVYRQFNGSGVIELNDNAVHNVRIEVKDAYQNTSELNFQVQFNETASQAAWKDIPGKKFYPNYVNVFEQNDFEAYLPENCIYDTVIPAYSKTVSVLPGAVSGAFNFGDAGIPLHSNFTVRIKPDKSIPAEWKNKIVIKNSYNDKKKYKNADWQNGWLSAEFGNFGIFEAFADLTPPEINSIGYGDPVNLSHASAIIFRPTDNSEIKSFRGELDDKWLMFTNDKGKAWIYRFDEHCPYGTHRLQVWVEDIAGNITTKTWPFVRNPHVPGTAKKAHGKTKKHHKKHN
jgi:murein DD-endopeptidase MepM/ murein hydrolase activator NlpD